MGNPKTPTVVPTPHVVPASAPVNEDAIELPPAPATRPLVVIGLGAVLIAGMVALFLVGLLPRLSKGKELRESTASASTGLPRVEVVLPHRTSGQGSITLPGNIEPLRDIWLYARASGYVHRWNVDIGDAVTEGQTLLELDTPELDAQLIQAQANEAQSQTAVELAKANRELARVTANRYDKLGPSGVASQQDVEERRTQLAVAEANVKAAEAAVDSQKANVNRLVDLKSFAKLVAPFSGLITARNVEKGQLVNAGASGGQGLFRLDHVDTVRVFIHVPQEHASEVQLGQPVTIALRDSTATFLGKVTNTAGALDAASRTLNTEVQIPNADHRLLAGMFVQATIERGVATSAWRVPTAALVADAHGTRLAVVDGTSKLKWLPVKVGRDMGTEIEIASGLQGDEQVVTVLPEGTPDGTQVEVRKKDGA